MLSIDDARYVCSRREMLQIGSLGTAGLALPALLSNPAAAGQPKHVTGKSVIFLFMQGGPSQLETFDPKPDAPQSSRTVTGVIPTALPSVHFGEALPRLARLADKLTVVRSYQTNNAGHNIQPIVGADSLDANIGAHYARVAGATRSATGMPTNAVVFPQAVSDEVTKGSARGDLASTGRYGKSLAPFIPGQGGQLQEDMKLAMPQERFFNDRQKVLSELDRLNRQVDASGQLSAADEIQAQAYQVLLGGGVADALDLSREDPQVVARYDTSKFAQPGRWNHVSRGRSGYYSGQAASIGKLLLMARRLCEAGCGFVTVHASYAGVWDMHADGNNLNMVDGMQAVGRSFDHAVAALVEDLEARGLTDEIMLVASGEMGRTPKINSRGGRDHWSKIAPLLLHGGGLPGGQIIGQSTKDAGQPATNPFGPKNLISTILHKLFDVSQLRLVSGIPPEITRLTEAEVIV